MVTNKSPYDELWEILNDYSSKLKLQPKIVDALETKLRNSYQIPQRTILDYTSKFTKFEIEPKIDEIMYAATLLMLMSLEFAEYDELNEDLNRNFNIVAKSFERILKETKKDLSIEKIRKLAIQTALCYDLSDNSANAKIIAEIAVNNRSGEDLPFHTFQRLEFLYCSALENMISRKFNSSKRKCFQALELKDSLESIITESKLTPWDTIDTIKLFIAYLDMVNALMNAIQFLEQGKQKYLENAVYSTKEASKNFTEAESSLDAFISNLFLSFLQKAKTRSIYTYLDSNNTLIQNYIGELLKTGIYEFWPSQIDAIKAGLLVNNNANLLMSAPTSAGKSLVAELAIVNYFAQYGLSSRCIYIVPTRALASQVNHDLKKRLLNLGIKISKFTGGSSSPDIDDLLLKISNICVCTPEKFHQLMKARHPTFMDSKLIIIDEAHLLGEDLRGLHLELIMTELLQVFSNKRLILFSAVLNNTNEIAKWIEAFDTEIRSEWSPVRTIHSKFSLNGVLEYYDDLADFKISIPDVQNEETLTGKAVALAKILQERFGLTLIFARSPRNAENIASKLFEKSFQQEEISDELKEVAKMIRDQLGQTYPLAQYIERRIAFHHGALPDTVRQAVEKLVNINQLKFICATTTLAEGLNTPVNCIVIPYLYQYIDGRTRLMKKSLFRNLAGRAGRALKNTEGQVLIIQSEATSDEDIDAYIRSNVETIEKVESHLVELVSK